MIKNTYEEISLSEMKHLAIDPMTVLVDVREQWEYEEFNAGGMNIPLADIRNQRRALEQYSCIIVICTNGVRSKIAAMDYCRVETWLNKRICHVRGGLIEAD
ncbi:rhodanese-like domain-containing protein [Dyadobacter tibetensis]|uniref:rhodanese-like domain-containing protein n=1 Tax=Dyadobacter tibetensis TaxID=1211851 RepID=UPI0004704937|nr:rhodanese-like domain-containing protein [Dyadobacter tibetensis]